MKPITYSELMKEVERLRHEVKPRVTFTKDQEKFLLACRDKEPKVSYKNMAILWKKAGWGEAFNHSMSRWYDIVKYGRSVKSKAKR